MVPVVPGTKRKGGVEDVASTRSSSKRSWGRCLGASADLFAKAKADAPAIVFIGEPDEISRSRTSGVAGFKQNT
jgi:hypothetical protein